MQTPRCACALHSTLCCRQHARSQSCEQYHACMHTRTPALPARLWPRSRPGETHASIECADSTLRRGARCRSLRSSAWPRRGRHSVSARRSHRTRPRQGSLARLRSLRTGAPHCSGAESALTLSTPLNDVSTGPLRQAIDGQAHGSRRMLWLGVDVGALPGRQSGLHHRRTAWKVALGYAAWAASAPRLCGCACRSSETGVCANANASRLSAHGGTLSPFCEALTGPAATPPGSKAGCNERAARDRPHGTWPSTHPQRRGAVGRVKGGGRFSADGCQLAEIKNVVQVVLPPPRTVGLRTARAVKCVPVAQRANASTALTRVGIRARVTRGHSRAELCKHQNGGRGGAADATFVASLCTSFVLLACRSSSMRGAAIRRHRAGASRRDVPHLVASKRSSVRRLASPLRSMERPGQGACSRAEALVCRSAGPVHHRLHAAARAQCRTLKEGG